MSDSNNASLAKSVYENLCKALESRGWKFSKHEEDLVVTFTTHGEDFPMDFVLAVDEERQMLRLFSRLPFTVDEDKRMEMAIATCAASFGLADGNFDYDITTGKISFRMTTTFRNSVIGDDLFKYMVVTSSMTVDEYNDKFFALTKGFISLEDFLKDT